MWAQVCACTPVCVHVQVCVQPAVSVWALGVSACIMVGVGSMYMCLGVLVHVYACVHVCVCVCMTCSHSSVYVRVHTCRCVLPVYTQLSALSMSHALCSGSPPHPPPAAIPGVSVTLMGHSSHKSRSEESGVAPPGARAGSASKGPACPPHLTLLLQPSRFWRELSPVPPSWARSISTV